MKFNNLFRKCTSVCCLSLLLTAVGCDSHGIKSVVEIDEALYDARYQELFVNWKPVGEELDANFLGTEVTLTTLSGKTLTTEILRDKNFPQAYNRTTVATAKPEDVTYRSIWCNEQGERVYSEPCRVGDVRGLEIRNVEYGKEISFKEMTLPQWQMYNEIEGTPESDLYYKILGNPPYGFCEDMLKTICGAMWFNADDPYVKLKKLECQFKPSDYLAYVTWDGDKTIMCVSQNHVKGLLTGDYEAGRDELIGVCYHELTHTIQVGISTASGADHYCFIEGGADASRIICRGFSEEKRLSRALSAVAKAEDQTENPNAAPHPWLNPYCDSGIFIAWLRRYDGDFWRKFNCSSQILKDKNWTLENAVKLILEDNVAVQKDIEAQGCKDDIVRGLWRVYKQDVESEKLN